MSWDVSKPMFLLIQGLFSHTFHKIQTLKRQKTQQTLCFPAILFGHPARPPSFGFLKPSSTMISVICHHLRYSLVHLSQEILYPLSLLVVTLLLCWPSLSKITLFIYLSGLPISIFWESRTVQGTW